MSYILTLTCNDRPGIVGAVGTALESCRCNIVESAQFGDPDTGRFMMRLRFETLDGTPRNQIDAALAPVSARFDMETAMYDATARPRALILVSKQDHCLNDLLYRQRTGSLAIDIVAIASNHPDAAPLAEARDIAFHHLPLTPDTKAAQEAQLGSLIERTSTELVVLARYMQVLSGSLCARLAGRAINIHHSFLPSFKGAKPYAQAHARGVKLIGATAHYVTADLDEGPIIEQEVVRVNHAMSVDELAELGRDIECQVLARAVRYHVERRVFLDGRKTVVFRS
jgi:formyltetrahydrofolate deformylase